MSDQKKLWVIMEVNYWSSLEVMGLPVGQYPLKGCLGFLPVFDDHDEAVKFAQFEENVFEIQPQQK